MITADSLDWGDLYAADDAEAAAHDAHLRYDPDAQWWRLEPEQQRTIALYRAIHRRERRPE